MKISVIIPCYNCEEFVHKAIESVLNQTHADWELILVDNNSSDGTFRVLKNFELQVPEKIKALQELKKGAPAARNRGLKAATGEWVQFFDADDELLPKKMENQLSIAMEKNADIVCGAFLEIEKLRLPEGFPKGYHRARQLILSSGKDISNNTIKTIKSPDTGNQWKAFIYSRLGITSANFWKREAVAAVNGWDENLSSSQEYDLLFRILKNGGKIAYDLETNTIIHKMENSISKTSDNNRLAQIMNNSLNLRHKVRTHLAEMGELDFSMKQYFDSYFYKYLMKYKEYIPEHVEPWFDLLDLQVPVLLKLRKTSKYYAKVLEHKMNLR